MVVWVGSLGWGLAGTGCAVGGGSLVRCWVLRERAWEVLAFVGGFLVVCVVLWGRLAVIPLRCWWSSFGGLLVFVVGGGVGWCLFVV